MELLLASNAVLAVEFFMSFSYHFVQVCVYSASFHNLHSSVKKQ